MDNTTCLNCGNDLTHTEGRRPKKFCNDSCRVSFSRKKKKGRTIVLVEDSDGQWTLDGRKCRLVYEDTICAEDVVIPGGKIKSEAGQDKKKKLIKMVKGVEPLGLNEKRNSTRILELENELSGITGTSFIAKSRKKYLEAEISKLKK